MSHKLSELRKLTDEQLIRLYDHKAEHAVVGIDYYSEELNRRSNEKTNKTMIRCTILITIMTVVMLLATVLNLHIILRK